MGLAMIKWSVLKKAALNYCIERKKSPKQTEEFLRTLREEFEKGHLNTEERRKKYEKEKHDRWRDREKREAGWV